MNEVNKDKILGRLLDIALSTSPERLAAVFDGTGLCGSGAEGAYKLIQDNAFTREVQVGGGDIKTYDDDRVRNAIDFRVNVVSYFFNNEEK